MELKAAPSPAGAGGAKATATAKDDDGRSLLKSSSASASSSDADPMELELELMEIKYAPYVRRDLYGTMGRGPLPPAERLRLALALALLLPLRLLCGLLVLLLYYLVCRCCTLCSSSSSSSDSDASDSSSSSSSSNSSSDPNPSADDNPLLRLRGFRRHAIVHAGRFCARAMLFVFGFYWISVEDRAAAAGASPSPSQAPGAIVSNHVSYVDILYHMSSSFPSFVAKASVARLPLVGLISKCLGCIYVHRESKASHPQGVAAAVTHRVQRAHHNDCPMMLLFPEGTTTNGDYLLPFKSGAFLAKAPVLPVILRYPYTRFSPAWDSISGMRHLFLLLSQFVNHLEVIKLPVYYPSDEEKGDPRLYANNVRKLIAKEGNLQLSEIGLSEKRVYHAALNGNSNSPPRDLQKKED